MTSKEIIAIFEQAAGANRADRYRQGNVIRLTGPGDVIMTGDLHDNERNFDKLVRHADLGAHSGRHLILHEIIHGHDCSQQWCESFYLLARAAQLKIQYPDQVHFLMGNHDMAQVGRHEILKNGLPMVRALLKGIEVNFSQNAPMVVDAMDEFLMSMPLVVRSENGIWMSHTLPGDRHVASFSDEIFQTDIDMATIKTNPHLKAFTWDRRHSESLIEQLCRRWGVVMFIMGHEPQADGVKRAHDRLLILSSDHPHGCFVQFDLQQEYSPDEIAALVKPLAAIR